MSIFGLLDKHKIHIPRFFFEGYTTFVLTSQNKIYITTKVFHSIKKSV